MRSFIFLGCFFSFGLCRNLPSFVDVCHRNDPQIEACLLRNVEKLRPRFPKGIPELSVPSFSPLVIPEAQLSVGSNFKATFKKIELHGVENFVIDELKFDPETLDLKLTITLPKLRVKSEYHLKGRLLVLDLDGNGPADGNYTNVKGIVHVTGQHYTKQGKDFVNLKLADVDVEIGKPHLEFSNIFGNNPELNDRTNQIINENILSIVEEVKPVVKEIVSQFVVGTVNRVFVKYSFDELFPK